MLELRKIKKSYRTKDFVQNALNGVDIAFRENEFTAILGASGSGKTTMLNIIGGLDQYDSGDLLIEGVSTKEYKSSNWDAYRNNRVGFVFQSYNLIPHQTVLSNVELALTLSGVSKKERKLRAEKALEEVGLKDHIYKLPTQLSGGQMQRVAIARALINDPEIVLADEPTGALDSTTSDQVMKLLEEIAKDRLVIMVTHNPELAHAYTNRIIELKDGNVIGDTNPYVIDEKASVVAEKSQGTKMSFFTAIALSVSNLMTKKGRTFITSLAGSIGIIGIASILALASGINLYIDGIEQETMSAYPLTIDTSGIDITSFMGSSAEMFSDTFGKDRADDEVPVLNSISSMFSHQNQNDLKSLKSYIDNNKNLIDPYVKNIQYKYGLTPEIFLEDQDPSIRQVNPESVFERFGLTDMGGMGMISGASEMGGTSFIELPGETSLFESQYDVLAGKWPSNKNEAVVVLMDNGALTDLTMYSLGLKDRVSLNEKLEGIINDETVVSDEDDKIDNIKFNDILGMNFKVINPAEKYAYDSNYDLWLNKSDDIKHMDGVIEKGEDLKIVGIIKSSDTTKTPMLQSGIYYTNDLSNHLMVESVNYDIVKAQLATPDINVLTGKAFDDKSQTNPAELFKFENMVTIDQEQIQKAFKFDTSKIDFDMSKLNANLDKVEFSEIDLEGLATTIANQINVPVDEVIAIFTNVLTDFIKEQVDLGIVDLPTMLGNFEEYINRPAVQEKISQEIAKLTENSQIQKELTTIIQNYFTEYMTSNFNNIMLSVQKDMAIQMEALMGDMATSIQSALSVDTNAMAKAFKINIDEDEIVDLIRSLMETGQTTQQSNLKAFGYSNVDQPAQINLYPKDFTTKENVVGFLDDYNQKMTNEKADDKVIKYTDFVGAMMSSVTTIINTISYALIAFVAISLIVSSIMIGVITYVSVLERIKEIGILRAIGASKQDIRRVFNAETLIIGFIAGSFGIFITYIISFFATILVHNKFGIPNIAHLEPQAAIILISISMFLAFISGLIPASSAANKDPVEALRSE